MLEGVTSRKLGDKRADFQPEKQAQKKGQNQS